LVLIYSETFVVYCKFGSEVLPENRQAFRRINLLIRRFWLTIKPELTSMVMQTLRAVEEMFVAGNLEEAFRSRERPEPPDGEADSGAQWTLTPSREPAAAKRTRGGSFGSPSPSGADLREGKTQEGNGRPEPLTGSGKENGLERRAKP
jgi:hypothetical protein